ncbi:GNAT family N-acetyltransferase [Bacterioplanes sanyensis]|uniref:GNAT family N-acetyltransferase n=1 Tax=Bacterioplanes sanyensis TaxID=1249553 RepID=A0A222FHZ3_9GAMM|nr:GNAT family N-acetyltransferase [Bacterioplanes sanyensis]ASP37843.1 GNAT family N-acetyltransferase [Bacterioplanes sanyensis]
MLELSLIKLLQNHDPNIAQEIYQLFQQSYSIESELIEAEYFPPLHRSSKNIASSNTQFYGLADSQGFIGAIEVMSEEENLDICSLVVSPRAFRRGVATQLLDYVLTNLHWRNATVSTACANKPAVNLYLQQGFSIVSQSLIPEGIEVVHFKKLAV